MDKLVNKILKILKDHVNENNREIQYNQEEINRMLNDTSYANRHKELDYKYALNKELLDENDDFINMQLRISEFMEKYSHLFTDDEAINNATVESEENEPMPYFNKTITGQMNFGPTHPQFNNPRFFSELLMHYQAMENYEMCDYLLKIKERDRTV
ncbi:MAG TPA: hypothetical protein VE870_08425 [Bacteroidales bacterium]|nr:hypothetical protein [Bacteroidales bacterium]